MNFRNTSKVFSTSLISAVSLATLASRATAIPTDTSSSYPVISKLSQVKPTQKQWTSLELGLKNNPYGTTQKGKVVNTDNAIAAPPPFLETKISETIKSSTFSKNFSPYKITTIAEKGSNAKVEKGIEKSQNYPQITQSFNPNYNSENEKPILTTVPEISTSASTIAKPEYPSVAQLSQPEAIVPTSTTPQSIQPKVSDIETKTTLTPVENKTNPPANPKTDTTSPENDPIASPEQNASEAESDPMGQVTSVSQLSDVQPTDWAFQALQSLVERYGCIAGYPDGTFKGNRAMTRYEFAAGLNACLDRITELIAASTADLVTEDDLSILQRLQEDFAIELANVKSRIDALEARTAELEANQFSTTSILFGSIRTQLSNYFEAEGDPQSTYQYNAYIAHITSFTGQDQLITAMGIVNSERSEDLAVTNQGRIVGATREGATDVQGSGNTDDIVRLIGLEYRFPITQKFAANVILANRFVFNQLFLRQFVPYYTPGQGPVSAFAETPPVFYLGAGAGLALFYEIFDGAVLSGTYLATFADSPGDDRGLFNGDYVANLIFNYAPNPKLFVQLVYQHGYFGTSFCPVDNPLTPPSCGNFGFHNGQPFRGNGFIGTSLANKFDDAGIFFPDASEVASNAYTISGYYEVFPGVLIGGVGTYINARLINRGDAKIWSWSVQAAFPDLFQRGDQGGLILGMEPTLTGLRTNGEWVGTFENDTSLHIEGYYKFRINDNIAITPSVIWITSPNQDHDNDNIVIGGIRTSVDF
ncbi:MAG: iron uptake porin [Microcoleaceae cyanobacterium MO_207.B10]|nr:iron uptake porin [Microcoleaceae cyanobacterium MO_207.B10]